MSAREIYHYLLPTLIGTFIIIVLTLLDVLYLTTQKIYSYIRPACYDAVFTFKPTKVGFLNI